MEDKGRALIEEVLKTAGTAGEHGFGYLVRYTMVDGILSAITWGGLILAALYLIRQLLAWKPAERDEGYIALRIAGICVICAIIFGFSCGLEAALAQAIMPQGAAISQAIHH